MKLRIIKLLILISFVQIPVFSCIKEASAKELQISFVGDILLAQPLQSKIDSFGIKYIFDKVKNIFKTSDLVMANLESAVADSGTPVNGKQYTFRAKKEILQGLNFAGINLVNLANNHVLDFGREAFEETMDNLSEEKINYVGAGLNLQQAFSPFVFKKNKSKVFFFGANKIIPNESWYAEENKSGIAGVENPDFLINQIKKVDKKALVVVYLHWGEEGKITPNINQRNLAKRLIDNGADIVVGSHPHVLQGLEFYKDKLIVYSLGNFVFNDTKNETMILNIKIDQNQILSANIVPCMIISFRPEPIKDSKLKNKFYKMIQNRSFKVKIDQSGKIINNKGDIYGKH